MVEGETPCDFTLRVELKDDPIIHYRVALSPEAAHVHVASIQLDADQASGKVVVEDNLVTLRGVRGRFAGGKIGTDADLDFRETCLDAEVPDDHGRESDCPRSAKAVDPVAERQAGRRAVRQSQR